jgi:hypothetical protein
MTNNNLADLIKRFDYMELQNEQLVSSLSLEEEILMTIEEFANAFGGDTLSIYYKDGQQIGFVRLGHDYRNTTLVLKTLQNITFNVQHPDNGLLNINLNEYR